LTMTQQFLFEIVTTYFDIKRYKKFC